MNACWNCKRQYLPGEAFCQGCGSDLSPLPGTGTPPPVAVQAAPGAVQKYVCDVSVGEIEGLPPCGYVGTMPGNICPSCGARWDPPIREEDAGRGKRSQGADGKGPLRPPQPVAATSQAAPTPAPPPAASPNKARAAPAPPVARPPQPQPEPTPPAKGQPCLVIEGDQRVLYKGNWTAEVPFEKDELTVGCRDTEQQHYPDIDLLRYRQQDPYLARRHAVFVREGHRYFVRVTTDADSTGYNSKDDVIGRDQRRELRSGDRIFFSESIVVAFRS